VTGGGRLRVEDVQMHSLCAAEQTMSTAKVLAAKECFLDLGAALPLNERAAVCQHTIAAHEFSQGAAACVLALRRLSRQYSDKEAVEICKGAHDATPAHCAAYVGRENNFIQCRGVRAVGSALQFLEFYYDGKAEGRPLRSRQIFSATLRVLDQFGQPTTETTSVIASIPLDKSQGALLEGLRTNTSVNGIVTLNTMRLSQAGNFSLRFRIASHSAPSAVVTLLVGDKEDQYRSPAGRCGALLVSMLRCFPVQDDEKSSAATKIVAATLPAETLTSGALAGCRSRLEEAGFFFAVGWRRETWVYYRQALVWIEASFYRSSVQTNELPGADIPAATRLGLQPDPDARSIKKAYHKLSLDWHPDRWLTFPLYTSHIQTFFSYIGDAYRVLESHKKEAGYSSEREEHRFRAAASSSGHNGGRSAGDNNCSSI